jgi:methyl-accepting chemotaxis protein
LPAIKSSNYALITGLPAGPLGGKMKIATKLRLAFGIILVLLLVIVVANLVFIKAIGSSMNKITSVNTVRMQKALEAQAGIIDVCGLFRNIVAENSAATLENELGIIQQKRAEYKQSLGKVEELDTSEKGKQLLADVKNSVAPLVQMNNQIVSYIKENRPEDARQLLIKDYNQQVEKTKSSFKALVDYQIQENKIRQDEASSYTQNAILISIVLGVLSIVFGIAAAIFITISITRPVTNLLTVIRQMAAGDLRVRAETTGKDEMGFLAAEVNEMTEILAGIMGQLVKNAEVVSEAAEQVSATAEQMATSSEELASQAATIATASEEMSVTSRDIASNCLQAANNSEQATEAATQGSKVVENTVTVMSQIARRVQDTARAVESLGARSDQIGCIIGTIEDIADQTNLLALNAAIEAARAGEQGRGFAVVADEVRALAERTTKATQEISTMIKAIQSETTAAVGDMEEGVKNVEDGTSEAAKSGQALEQIYEQIDQVTLQVNQIATAAEQQTSTTHEISQNILHLREVMAQTAVGAHHSADAARRLHNMAGSMNLLVARFQY